MLDFLKESYNEFKKVEWPSKDETKKLTLYVIGISIAIGLFVGGIDFIFEKFLSIYIS